MEANRSVIAIHLQSWITHFTGVTIAILIPVLVGASIFLIQRTLLISAQFKSLQAELAEKARERSQLLQELDLALTQLGLYIGNRGDGPSPPPTLRRLNANLAAMDARIAEADADAKQAKENLASLQKQIAAGTFVLPPEMQGLDPEEELRSLEQERLSLQREREIVLMDHGPTHRYVVALDARIALADKQSDQLRAELSAKYPPMVLENVKRAASYSTAVVSDLRIRREDLRLQISDFPRWFNEYQPRDKKVKELQEQLNDLDRTIAMLKAQIAFLPPSLAIGHRSN